MSTDAQKVLKELEEFRKKLEECKDDFEAMALLKKAASFIMSALKDQKLIRDVLKEKQEGQDKSE